MLLEASSRSRSLAPSVCGWEREYDKENSSPDNQPSTILPSFVGDSLDLVFIVLSDLLDCNHEQQRTDSLRVVRRM